jgi:hypothetical protein
MGINNELSVCTVCIHLLANGEYVDGTDAELVAMTGLSRGWGSDLRNLTADGKELGFSSSPCEGCGDTLHGDRFRAHYLGK